MSEFTFKLPDLGEGTVEAEIAEWMVKVGDVVAEEDPICAMLTDKAAVELTAPVSGRVISVAGEAGETVTVGAPLIVFETDGAGAAAEVPQPAQHEADLTPQSEPDPGPAPESVAPQTGRVGKVMTSPSIRARARELGVDLQQVRGSGPHGRIVKADFERFLAAGPSTTTPPPTQTAARQPLTGKREVKVIGLRRKIAERITASASDIPHFSYVEEVDVTALESLRQALNARQAPGEPALTPLAFLGLALVRILRDFPQCNAHYEAQRNVLVQYDAVHLGIATQTPDGLKVPVIRHAEALSLAGLAAEIRRLSAAARDNAATRDDLSGSTITITSLGKLGGIVSTPIINQPEVAIVGVNRMVQRPVVIGGRVEVRTMMNLSSSFDHRFVDGYDGAVMIQGLKELLEQPALIFMRD